MTPVSVPVMTPGELVGGHLLDGWGWRWLQWWWGDGAATSNSWFTRQGNFFVIQHL